MRYEWSEIKEPCEDCRYHHITLESPIGKFSIEWKGWKEHDSYCIYLNSEYIDVVNDIEDAKIFVKNYLTNLINDLMEFMGD